MMGIGVSNQMRLSCLWSEHPGPRPKTDHISHRFSSSSCTRIDLAIVSILFMVGSLSVPLWGSLGYLLWNYTAYHWLYTAEKFIKQSQIIKDDSCLCGKIQNVENNKYWNQHPLSLHPIIPLFGAAKKANGLFFGGVIGEYSKVAYSIPYLQHYVLDSYPQEVLGKKSVYALDSRFRGNDESPQWPVILVPHQVRDRLLRGSR